MIKPYYNFIFAYLLALPIGCDRELSRRQFGLRTFPLVVVVTFGRMLVGISVIESTDGEAHVIQGIITGIDPYLFGFPALGVIGYMLSVVLGLWLVITILRTRKY